MSNRLPLLAAVALALTLPPVGQAAAQDLDTIATGEVRTGWRMGSGDHMAALHLKLEPGWKTYWRAPGDAGIPPVFDWSGSRNAERVTVVWPTPQVFDQSGMRSVGYSDALVLPLRISPDSAGDDITLSGTMQMGLCRDICLPHTIAFTATLPAAARRSDPTIAAAMADVPFSATEAGVRSVRCKVAQTDDGLRLTAEIEMPHTGGREALVIEPGNPMIWTTEPSTERSGDLLTAQAEMMHVAGDAFALDRSAVRITVLGAGHAVDIQGCDR